MTLFVGVDPGKVGALAVLSEAGAIVETVATPVVKGDRPEYDLPEIRDFFVHYLAEAQGQLRVTVERAAPMPPKLGGSAANFARGVARAWEWMLVALGIPYQLVPPQAWQRAMLLGTSGDDTGQRSIMAAKRLWPAADLRRSERARKDDHGITDALLIAEFGRRAFVGVFVTHAAVESRA